MTYEEARKYLKKSIVKRYPLSDGKDRSYIKNLKKYSEARKIVMDHEIEKGLALKFKKNERQLERFAACRPLPQTT
jgi:Uri superfamily endonuclease